MFSDITTSNFILLLKSNAFFNDINLIVFISFSSVIKFYYNLLSTMYLADFSKIKEIQEVSYLCNILNASSMKFWARDRTSLSTPI